MRKQTNSRPRSGRRLALGIASILALISTPVFAAADIRADFDPTTGTISCNGSGNQCEFLDIKVIFKNDGDQASTARNVYLNRFNGSRATGYAQRFGGSGAFQRLDALQPGQTVTLTWRSNRVPIGTQTYKLRYSPALNEGGRAQNMNHNKEATYNVVLSGSSSSSSSSNSSSRSSSPSRSQSFGRSSASSSSTSSSVGPDVVANFVSNNGTVTCNGSGNRCDNLTIQIRFKNEGTAASQQRRVTLNQFNGRRATGYATRFGGSGAFQTLNSLDPGAEQTVSWTANRVLATEYTFKPVFSPALNEGGGNKNANHTKPETLRVVVQP